MATGGWGDQHSSLAPDVCKYPGCSKPRYREWFTTHDFCSRSHADMYMRQFGPITSLSSYHRSTSSSPTYKVGGGSHLSTTSSSSKSKPLKALHNLPNVFKRNGKIKFYNRDDPYYEFTNFYRVPISIDGNVWPTTEHYFQAQKFVGTPYVEVIRKLASAREAFQKSREPSVSKWRRSDWDSVKDDIMLKALRCKFTQHRNLQDKLLWTEKKELIEHTSNDSYWGDGGDGKGLNKLGTLLMQVRGELQKKNGDPPKPTSGSVSSGASGDYFSRPLQRSASFSGLPTSSRDFDQKSTASYGRSRLTAKELGYEVENSSKKQEQSKPNKSQKQVPPPLYSYSYAGTNALDRASRTVKAVASPSLHRRKTPAPPRSHTTNYSQPHPPSRQPHSPTPASNSTYESPRRISISSVPYNIITGQPNR